VPTRLAEICPARDRPVATVEETEELLALTRVAA
jgi:hypothetical protein